MGANGEVRLGSQGEIGTGIVGSDLVAHGPAVLVRTGMVRRRSEWRDKAVMEWNGRDSYGLTRSGSLGLLSLGSVRSHEVWQSGIGAEGYKKVRRVMVRQSRYCNLGFVSVW